MNNLIDYFAADKHSEHSKQTSRHCENFGIPQHIVAGCGR